MLNIELVTVLIAAILLVVIAIEQSFLKQRIQKGQLTCSLVNVFFILAIWLIYDKYIAPNATLMLAYYIILFAELAVFAIVITIILVLSRQRTYDYEHFMESLNSTSWNVFYICDRRDRIREISASFLEELGLTREEVIGKKAFDVFDKCIRFTKVNDHDYTNKELREFYEREFVAKAKPDEEYQREIYFQNNNGQTIVYNLVEKPLYVSNKYRGRLNIGQKKNDASLTQVERDLVKRNSDLESIQFKFIAALELMEEGFFYNNLDQNYIWQNDILLRDLGLKSSTISFIDYRGLIHPDDVAVYTNILKDLTPERPTYSLTYRVKCKNKYEFVKESGKRIFEDASESVIVGFARVIRNNNFEKTNTEVDNVKNVDQLLTDLDALFNDRRVFQLVCVNLTSLPDINNQFGRNVGNMIMDEYIKNVRQNFLTETSEMYRASGLTFYFTITDVQKMELFKRVLKSNDQAMNLTMNYGSMKATLEVNVGIAESNVDGMNRDELMKNCNYAINMSLNQNYRLNYAYFREVKNNTIS